MGGCQVNILRKNKLLLLPDKFIVEKIRVGDDDETDNKDFINIPELFPKKHNQKLQKHNLNKN